MRSHGETRDSASRTHALDLITRLMDSTSAGKTHWQEAFSGQAYIANSQSGHCAYMLDEQGLHYANSKRERISSLSVRSDDPKVADLLASFKMFVQQHARLHRPTLTLVK